MARRWMTTLALLLALTSVPPHALARPLQVPEGTSPEESPPESIPEEDDIPPVPLPPARELPPGREAPMPEPSDLPTPPVDDAPLDLELLRVGAGTQPQAAGAVPGALPPFADRLGEGPQEVGLLVDVTGPAAVNLNIETKLVITLRNQGKDDAHEVVVRDALPANLQYIEATPKPDQQDQGVLSWRLGTVPTGTEKTIELKVKPIAPGPIDHVPRIDFSTGSKARMTILKPELKVELAASRPELQKGETVDFNLTVTNTGDGPARDVVLQAVITKGLQHEGDASTFSQDLGDLGPKQTIGPIPFTVTGIALGEHTCEVSALSADVVPAAQPASVAKASVNIVSPELTVDVTGPATWLKGSLASFTIKVTNKGTAPALDIDVAAAPPYTGVPKLSADATSVRDDEKGVYKIYWKIPRLEPGQTKEIQLPIRLDKIQNYVLNVAANARGAREGERLETVRDQLTTEVSGIPDIQIVETGRTSQVIGLGDETELTIRLKNVGSQEAKAVQVGFFTSDKLKIIATEGTDQPAMTDPSKPNRGVFPPIDRIEPGAERVLYVKVAGQAGGVADFRVKVFWEGMSEEQAVEHKTFVRVADAAGQGTTSK